MTEKEMYEKQLADLQQEVNLLRKMVQRLSDRPNCKCSTNKIPGTVEK